MVDCARRWSGVGEGEVGGFGGGGGDQGGLSGEDAAAVGHDAVDLGAVAVGVEGGGAPTVFPVDAPLERAGGCPA